MEKSTSKYYGTFISLGICFGTTFGIIMNNIGLWMSIGLLIGVSIDTLVNVNKKNKKMEGTNDRGE